MDTTSALPAAGIPADAAEASLHIATAGSEPRAPHLLVIEPRRKWLSVDVGELWQQRDLLYFLTLREVSVRYKQTALGVAWAVLQPLLTMLVFAVFLGKLAKVPSDGVPYPLFAYLGILPWTYFSMAVTRSVSTLITNANFLTKVYFPRTLMPLSATMSALVDFVLAFMVLCTLFAWYHIMPSWGTLLLIPLSFLTAVAALGIGMALSALNVKYRDIQQVLPFFLQIWMYATPIVYPASVIPAKWRPWFALNPLTGIMQAYRDAPLGRPIDWSALSASAFMCGVVFIIGLALFQRMERQFADVV